MVDNGRADLDDQQKEQVFVLLTDVFSSSSSDVGRTNKFQHEIHIGGNRPIRQAARRIPPHRRQEVQNLLLKMRETDVIQPPWASPIVLVRKKDNSFRFCIDYRKLNVTHKDAYPLPWIDDTLNTMAGSKWFSTLDLASWYWQVEVAKKDLPKTVLSKSEGLFELRSCHLACAMPLPPFNDWWIWSCLAYIGPTAWYTWMM